MEYIKINIPADEKEYRNGNGEGVFVLVQENVKYAYVVDEKGTEYTGILDNDSWYWPDLKHGTEIRFEMRGQNRPVVSWDWLVNFVD